MFGARSRRSAAVVRPGRSRSGSRSCCSSPRAARCRPGSPRRVLLVFTAVSSGRRRGACRARASAAARPHRPVGPAAIVRNGVLLGLAVLGTGVDRRRDRGRDARLDRDPRRVTAAPCAAARCGTVRLSRAAELLERARVAALTPVVASTAAMPASTEHEDPPDQVDARPRRRGSRRPSRPSASRSSARTSAAGTASRGRLEPGPDGGAVRGMEHVGSGRRAARRRRPRP